MNDVAGQPIPDARAWRSANFASEDDWITRLNQLQIDGLIRAADTLPADSADWLHFDLNQQPGDVLFISNLAVMHRREKYVDVVDDAKKRLLYRMWINLHDARPVVASHAALRKGIRGPEPVIASIG